MDPILTEGAPDGPSPGEAPPLPLVFRCAIWVPVFAVVVFVMMRLFGATPTWPSQGHGDADHP